MNQRISLSEHKWVNLSERYSENRAGRKKHIKESDRYIVQTVIGCENCMMCSIRRENICEKGFKAIGYQFNGGFEEYMKPAYAAFASNPARIVIQDFLSLQDKQHRICFQFLTYLLLG